MPGIGSGEEKIQVYEKHANISFWVVLSRVLIKSGVCTSL